MATNKHLQNRVNHLISLGIPQAQAIVIAYSEIPTMTTGGNIDSNYLQDLEDQSYDLDEYYKLLQSERDLDWAKGIQTETDRINQDIENSWMQRAYEDIDKHSKEAQNELILSQNSQKKLSNPYAGYSMEDALMGMGRFIGGDRSFGNALGFIKAPIAGARTYMSGMGLARREKDAREKYEEEQRRGMVDDYKEGGEISNDFLTLIESLRTNKLNKKGLPVNENKNRMYQNIHDIFYKDNTELRPPTFQTGGMPFHKTMSTYEDFLNMKRQEPTDGILKSYERDSYERDNKRMINEATDIYNWTKNPTSPEMIEKYREYKKYNDSVNNVIKKRIEEDLINKGLIYKDGGSLTFPERMTGEYIQGIPEDSPEEPVVELEDGEHTLQPDGTMSEVKGKKHNQGGEKLTSDQIEEGTIVVSDHLKIGGKNAKYFREKYDVKVKASDTYATVVDKVKKKVGLDKLNKEQEKVIEEIQKQEKGTKDIATKNINLEFLSEKINELEEEKQLLEEAVKQALVDVYNVQESEKSPEEQEPVVDTDILNQVAQQYDIPEEQAMGIVQEYLKGGKIPKMQNGSIYNIYGTNMVMTDKGLIQKRPEAIPNITQEFWKDTKNLPQISQEIGIEAFLEDFENTRFIKGEPYTESEMKAIQEEIERRIAMIDNLDTPTVNKNILKDILQQSVEQVGIIQGTDDSNEIEEDTTQTTGTRGDKETPPQEQVNFTWDEIQALKGVERDSEPDGSSNYWKNRMRGLFTNPGWDEEGINHQTDSSLLNNTGFHNRTVQKLIDGEISDTIDEDITEEGYPKPGGEKKDEKNSVYPDFFTFPDQSVSPPNSMVAPLKGTVRLGRADAYRIDPAQLLTQNQRNFDAQMAQIGNLPPAQRSAAQAALLAEKNNADNQVINSIAAQNAQIESETDRFNLGRSDMEEQLALQNALSYEDRMFRTQAAYDANLDAYYDYMRNLNVARYNDIRNQNMVNSIFENYQVNPDGTIGVKPDSERFFELNRMLGQNKK